MEAFIEFRTGELGHTANAYLSEDGETVTVSFTFHLRIYVFKANEFFKHLKTIESKCFENYIKADRWFAKELLKGLKPIKIEQVIV